MPSNKKTLSIQWNYIGLIVLLASAIVSAIHPVNLNQLFGNDSIPDPYRYVSRQSKCLMSALPENGLIGFVLRLDGSAKDLSNPHYGYLFFLTQYYLAPRILLPSPEHRWIVVALFMDPNELSEIPDRYNAKLEMNCGDFAVYQRVAYPK